MTLCLVAYCYLGNFLIWEGVPMYNNNLTEKKRTELIEKILNHQVQGEVYILTPGRIWKSLVLKEFNKVYSGELSVEELLNNLEKIGVKYNQKHSLVRYPVEDCLRYIGKLSKKPLNESRLSS